MHPSKGAKWVFFNLKHVCVLLKGPHASLAILQMGHQGITFDWDTQICHSVKAMRVEGFQEGIEAYMQEVPCFMSASMKGNFCLANLANMQDH